MKTFSIRVTSPRSEPFWNPTYVRVAVPGAGVITMCNRAAKLVFGELPKAGKSLYYDMALAAGLAPAKKIKKSPR